MKKVIVLTYLFLCFVVGLHAQLNETYLSFHGINSAEFGRGASLSYFRNFSQSTALGIRANMNGIFSKNNFSTYAGSVDVTHRWNFSKNEKFRLLAELGASVLRRYDEPMFLYFCGTISPTDSFLPVYHDQHDRWARGTYFGMIGSVGFDIRFGKHLIAGMDVYTSYYQTQSTKYYYPEIQLSNIRLRVGSRF